MEDIAVDLEVAQDLRTQTVTKRPKEDTEVIVVIVDVVTHPNPKNVEKTPLRTQK